MTAKGEMADALFTIGYEKASLTGFVAELKGAGVEMLVDVRDRPWSRRPEFRRETLRKSLLAAGIGYVHIRALGNPKEGRDAAKAGDVEVYLRHMDARLASADGQAGLVKAAELARKGPICLMCYERDPADCHRSRVADNLVARANPRAHSMMRPYRGAHGLGAPRHLFAS